MEVRFYDSVNDSLLRFAVIIAVTDGKWVFCKHKDRNTYEIPGGHRDDGESVLETAERELREETGARRFSIEPVCAYSVTGRNRVNETGEEMFGMLYVAEITEFYKELHSEMEKVVISEELPTEWTYPLIQPELIKEAGRRGYLKDINTDRDTLKVRLCKMTDEEFREFKEYSIADYANDLENGQGLDKQQALVDSEKEFNDTLPDGPETEGQFLMSIEDVQNNKPVGFIWFAPYEEAGIRRVWLSDFLIYEEYRRKGYGKAALTEMEKMAKEAGCSESILYVWDHNPAGYSLYQKCGYRVFRKGNGGAVMMKDL